MKVLDPQSALLTTAEVHQFLKENPIREQDKKVGSYATVNVANNHLVRRDVEHYTELAHPVITTYPPVQSFMRQLLTQLKRYELTKTEVFTLVNLGVGLDQHSSSAVANGHSKTETNGDVQDEDDEGENLESDLSKSLFRLIVEESEERFAGDEGEEQIDEILSIIKDNIQGNGQGKVVNGHTDKATNLPIESTDD